MYLSENKSSLSQNKRKYDSYVRALTFRVLKTMIRVSTYQLRDDLDTTVHLNRMNIGFSKVAVSGKLILHVTCLRKLVI